MSLDTPFPYIAVLGIIVLISVVGVFFFGAVVEQIRSPIGGRVAQKNLNAKVPKVVPLVDLSEHGKESARHSVDERIMEEFKIDQKKQLTSLEQKIRELTLSNEALDVANRNLRKDLVDVKAELTKGDKRYEEQLIALRMEAQNSKKIAELADYSRNELYGEVAKLKGEVSDLNLEKSKITLAWTGEISDLKVRNEALQDQIEAANAEIGRISVVNGNRKVEDQELSAANEALKLQVDQSQEDVLVLNNKLEAAVQLVSIRETVIVALESQLTNQTDAFQSANLELQRLTSVCDAQSQRITDLEVELSEKKDDLARKSEAVEPSGESTMVRQKEYELHVKLLKEVLAQRAETIAELESRLATANGTRELSEPEHRDTEQADPNGATQESASSDNSTRHPTQQQSRDREAHRSKPVRGARKL